MEKNAENKNGKLTILEREIFSADPKNNSMIVF
jgi:hypothetical protein